MTNEQLEKFLAEPDVRTWQEGWDEVTKGFADGWRWHMSRMVYQELYRALTHGHGMSPDDALSTLGGAYHAAVSDRELA